MLLPRNVYDILYKEINSRIIVKEINSRNKYFQELFSVKNEKKILNILKDLILKNKKEFDPLIKYLQKKVSLLDPKQPIVLFETGAFGTSLKFSEYILKLLFPKRKIYTSIVFGSPVSKSYIDYVYSASSNFTTSAKHFESYPKIKKSLSSLKVSKRGKVYGERKEPRIYTDPNDYLFEGKIFNLALGNMLVYKNKGVDISNPSFMERYIWYF